MDARQALEKADFILQLTAQEKTAEPFRHDFRKFADFVAQAVKHGLRGEQKKLVEPWLRDWAVAWRRLYDDYSETVRRDPMLVYRPANRACREFHESRAFIRYFCSGNRCGKTTTGYAEHYLLHTGQNSYRPMSPPPNNSFIIGLSFKQYVTNVFERKMLIGEKDNPLSPMFPEGGAWLHHYDERKHTLYISCAACKAKGQPTNCRHTSTVTLFSDDTGWEMIQGAQMTMGHFDEHIDEKFYLEAWQRLQQVKDSCMIVTGTPLHGYEAWEQRRLASVALGDPKDNRARPDEEDSPPLVTVHTIDQFEAGLVDPQKIKASMKAMDEFEIEGRVYGRPAPLAEFPVFDRKILAEMRTSAKTPSRGVLRLAPGQILETVLSETDIHWEPAEAGNLRVWEQPVPGATYVAGIDSAAGLIHVAKHKKRDASCASILKVEVSPEGRLKLRMVAQYHGWINPYDYAEELFKLCVWYNSALAIIELTGGLGRAVMIRMKDLSYWNLFRDTRQPEFAEFGQDARFGVDTNSQTKPAMVGAVQSLIQDRLLDLPCRETIGEMVAFEQERTESGLNVRFRGAGGSADDRVMSLCIACGVVTASPQFNAVALAEAASNSEVRKTDLESAWDDVHKELKERLDGDTYDVA